LPGSASLFRPCSRTFSKWIKSYYFLIATVWRSATLLESRYTGKIKRAKK
jgi:hypothetical protein